MINILPYSPLHSTEWLEKFFKKGYYKKPYDRFMWWRSYTPKLKPLHTRTPFRDRLINGDFDVAPYKFEAEIVEHRMNEKFLECRGESEKFTELTSLDRARRKRLMEDFNKEESKRLEELKNNFVKEFKMTKEQYDMEVVNTNSNSLIDFYYEMEDKYKLRAIRSTFPPGLIPASERCKM
jgi:hypothetical protein